MLMTFFFPKKMLIKQKKKDFNKFLVEHVSRRGPKYFGTESPDGLVAPLLTEIVGGPNFFFFIHTFLTIFPVLRQFCHIFWGEMVCFWGFYPYSTPTPNCTYDVYTMSGVIKRSIATRFWVDLIVFYWGEKSLFALRIIWLIYSFRITEKKN